MRQESCFVGKSAVVADEPAACAENSVAGNDYTYGVTADCTADRLRGHAGQTPLFGQKLCYFSVGHSASVLERAYNVDDIFSEWSQAVEAIAGCEVRAFAGEIDVQPFARLREYRQLGLHGQYFRIFRAGGVFKAQAGQAFAVGGQYYVGKPERGFVTAQVGHSHFPPV